MSALFILSFIQENSNAITESYFLGISVAVIGGLLIIIGGFIKILYAKHEKMSVQVIKNEAAIGLNKQKDESTLDRFVDYQKLMSEKDGSLQKTLDGINDSISKLNETTGDLAVQVGKLEAKIK